MATLTRSAVALGRVLDEGGELAGKHKARFHPTYLWRWRHGKRKASLALALLVAEITGGEVPADGWGEEPGLLPAPKRVRKPTRAA